MPPKSKFFMRAIMKKLSTISAVICLACVFLSIVGCQRSGELEAGQDKFISENCIFGFTDAAGTRVIAETSNSEKIIKQPGIFTNVIVPGNKVLPVKYIKEQSHTAKDSGRQTVRNFDNLQGSIFGLVDGKIEKNMSCLLVSREFVDSIRPVSIISLKNEKCDDKQIMKRIEGFKRQKIDKVWGLVKLEQNTGIYLVLFEKRSEDVLASIIMAAPDKMVALDFPAKFNKTSTWRVDDGGNIAPESFNVAMAWRRNNNLELVISWGGEEGENTDLYSEKGSVFVSLANKYRYWLPE